MEAEDYDRLDAESVLLHGKRILQSNLTVRNEWQARKLLGPNYIAPNEVFTFGEMNSGEMEGSGMPQIPVSLGVQPDIQRGLPEEYASAESPGEGDYDDSGILAN